MPGYCLNRKLKSGYYFERKIKITLGHSKLKVSGKSTTGEIGHHEADFQFTNTTFKKKSPAAGKNVYIYIYYTLLIDCM